MSAILHMVTFTLHTGKDNEEAEAFLEESRKVLTGIPGVGNFEVLRQVSTKNEHDYGFSMKFADQGAYEAYNAHPVHVKYVAEVWESKVRSFRETDLVAWE
ncbi:Dabb family protein [Saccharibacillus deserti]|uniref:Dabb family protein n=1 Tax=Saccharibacillus deserti TaxID=1634444 RepID=UPI0031B5B7B3